MSDLTLCDEPRFLNAWLPEATILARSPWIPCDLDPTAMTPRPAEVNTIEADEETIATNPTGLVGMEAGTAAHAETVMPEKRVVERVTNDMIAVRGWLQGQMLPAIGILTVSQYSLDDRCGTWRPTTATGNLYKMVVGNNQALVASHDTAARAGVKQEVKMRGVKVATVADPVKIGPATREEDQCAAREKDQEMARVREHRDAWATTDETTVATTETLLRGSGGAMCLRCRQTTGTRG